MKLLSSNSITATGSSDMDTSAHRTTSIVGKAALSFNGLSLSAHVKKAIGFNGFSQLNESFAMGDESTREDTSNDTSDSLPEQGDMVLGSVQEEVDEDPSLQDDSAENSERLEQGGTERRAAMRYRRRQSRRDVRGGGVPALETSAEAGTSTPRQRRQVPRRHKSVDDSCEGTAAASASADTTSATTPIKRRQPRRVKSVQPRMGEALHSNSDHKSSASPSLGHRSPSGSRRHSSHPTHAARNRPSVTASPAPAATAPGKSPASASSSRRNRGGGRTSFVRSSSLGNAKLLQALNTNSCHGKPQPTVCKDLNDSLAQDSSHNNGQYLNDESNMSQSQNNRTRKIDLSAALNPATLRHSLTAKAVKAAQSQQSGAVAGPRRTSTEQRLMGAKMSTAEDTSETEDHEHSFSEDCSEDHMPDESNASLGVSTRINLSAAMNPASLRQSLAGTCQHGSDAPRRISGSRAQRLLGYTLSNALKEEVA